MTLASVLFGGASAAPYRAGNLYPAILAPSAAAAATAGRDYLIPFIPRVNMLLDRVAWNRDVGTAADVYVGLYSSAGTLLTDCAVDADTTTGWHLVDSTNVALTANTFYWLCLNASVDVTTMQDAYPIASSAGAPFVMVGDAGLAVGIGTADTNLGGSAQLKARANAALLANLTMSGFTLAINVPMMGIVAA